MKILDRLTKFYSNELSGVPHTHVELFELAWDLAELLEDFGVDSNAWKSDEDEFDAMLEDLRAKHTVSEYVTLIDTLVHEMHQTLLDNENEDCEPMLQYSQGDIVDYLLNRNNDEYFAAFEEAIREEMEEYLEEMEWEI